VIVLAISNISVPGSGTALLVSAAAAEDESGTIGAANVAELPTVRSAPLSRTERDVTTSVPAATVVPPV